MFPPVVILYDPDINIKDIDVIVEILKKTYNIHIKEIREYTLDFRAYNETRNQYDGQKLLNKLIEKENIRFFFYIINRDLYVPIMNFVFGLASKYYGAIVSFYRLNNMEMKIKESIHECGHVLGLEHCENFCVMQFSNSLMEAEQKPAFLCKNCVKIIENISAKF